MKQVRSRVFVISTAIVVLALFVGVALQFGDRRAERGQDARSVSESNVRSRRQPIEDGSEAAILVASGRADGNRDTPAVASGAGQEAEVGQVTREEVDLTLWSHCEPFFRDRVLGPSVEERAQDISRGMRFQARELATLPEYEVAEARRIDESIRVASEQVAKAEKAERVRLWEAGDYQRNYAGDQVEPLPCNETSFRGSLSYGSWSVEFAVDPDKSLDYAIARDALNESRIEKFLLLQKYSQ